MPGRLIVVVLFYCVPPSSSCSIHDLATDVESALEKNFDPSRVSALSAVFSDFLTLRRIGEEVADRVGQGGGIPGASRIGDKVRIYENL